LDRVREHSGGGGAQRRELLGALRGQPELTWICTRAQSLDVCYVGLYEGYTLH
jgi:hypothetical protein